MSNFKMPDINGLKNIANKLYTDIKKSVTEIAADLKTTDEPENKEEVKQKSVESTDNDEVPMPTDDKKE